MSISRRRHYLAPAVLGVVLCLVCSCADETPKAPPDLGPPILELVNQGTGDDRPLEQVKLHSDPGNYGPATNLLSAPLSPGERFSTVDFSAGSYYLTVVRKQLSTPVSDLIALTTSETIDLTTGRVEVWVFDESFRVFDATPSADAGVAPDRSAVFDLANELADGPRADQPGDVRVAGDTSSMGDVGNDLPAVGDGAVAQ